ncbi:MAG: hypothetical protein ACRD0U_19670 [Acidimicrobiales bacterium]
MAFATEVVVAAHVLALRALIDGHRRGAYNVGLGRGFSVLKVLDAVDEIVGRPARRLLGRRRAGDPAVLIAHAGRAREHLGWRPQYSELAEMIETAWRWHRQHPNGFARATAIA